MSLESIAKLADLTGLSRESVSRKLRGLPFHTGERNSKLFESQDVLPVLYGLDEREEAVDLNAARAKLAEKQVEKIDFDMELKSGAFIPYDVMLSQAQRVFVAFRTRICSIPTKLAPKVASMDDPIDVEEALDEHLTEALEELHDLGEFIKRFDSGPTLVRGSKKSQAT
jgi:hypothetical protein